MKALKKILISFGAIILVCILLLCVLLATVLYPSALVSGGGEMRVVCVGDSITYGQGVIGSRRTNTYTAMLAELTDSTVVNYGLCNRTLLSVGDMPYTSEKHYAASLLEDADVVIIMLGSNDSKPAFWNKEAFISEYRTFAESYLNMISSPQVYLMIPPKIYVSQDGGNCDDSVVGGELADVVRSLGDELNLEVIDLYTLTTNHPEWFADGLHPNAEGNAAIAEEISKYIK